MVCKITASRKSLKKHFLLSACGAGHTLQYLEKQEDIRTEGKATEGGVLIPPTCACCCQHGVWHSIVLSGDRENCISKMSSAQNASGGNEVLTGGLFIYLFDELRSFREAEQYFCSTDEPTKAWLDRILDKPARDWVPCDISCTSLLKKDVVA